MASTQYKQRYLKFNELLNVDKDGDNDVDEAQDKDQVIDTRSLRRLCFDIGCPDDHKHVRSLVWKILLGYLPSDRSQWTSHLAEKRKLYNQFVSELIISDDNNVKSPDDHPLNTAPNSHWKNYFRDNEVLSQIYKDVRRLYPDISFFQQRIAKTFTKSTACDVIGRTSSKAYTIDVIRNCFGATEIRDNQKKYNTSDDNDFDSTKSLDGQEFHWQIVARVLFIYAKLNPGQGYVQGMNEIIGPLYYVFANDHQNGWSDHSEADTFWCFTSLMSEIRDIYNSHADSDHSTGIVSLMTRLTGLLSKEDNDLYHRITLVQAIKPHYYAFRWLTLLLSQEFPLPDVLRLWDFLFSDEKRFNFLLQTCCAMICLIRSELMNGDFATNMKLLQNFPEHIDINQIIARAKQIHIT
ncbi:TBC1 domain family member 13-like [Oppia nitens]|uniref:TBC1 domain family member 13-like n=1 Tax=Oppia nitens TaxID=1686743 RepID=UPI0023DA3074|nr:TBC1 domain family member 13-like [Oppia nitens]